MTYLQSLNKALFELFEADKRVYLIGEDLLDPYGGAFKVSKGLSTKFPERVISTPISESCITGIGAGMAIRGLRPIIEIMFGDFVTLAVDQIINHIAKFRQMYNYQVKVPIVLRMPMGGGRGYGPTHSQSLEKLFFGIPGLKIVAPTQFHHPGELLEYAVLKDDTPVIFIEHKLLYPVNLISDTRDSLISVELLPDKPGYPIALAKNFKTGNPDIVIISYGGMGVLIESLLRKLYHEEIKIIACFPSLISSVLASKFLELIKSSGRVIIVEEGTGPFGWSAEVSADIYEQGGDCLSRPIKRITSFNSIIPAARHLENKVLPNKEIIEQAIEEIML
jgi:pyruvate/2-oxoglutarate/acetoin dehydrogenase E1 component